MGPFALKPLDFLSFLALDVRLHQLLSLWVPIIEAITCIMSQLAAVSAHVGRRARPLASVRRAARESDRNVGRLRLLLRAFGEHACRRTGRPRLSFLQKSRNDGLQSNSVRALQPFALASRGFIGPFSSTSFFSRGEMAGEKHIQGATEVGKFLVKRDVKRSFLDLFSGKLEASVV